jgi:ParB-like chromosome segregation protein Spo0J
MNTTAANIAAPAPAPKQAPWMACTTVEELNAYLKKAKKSHKDAEAIRAKWVAVQQGDINLENAIPNPPGANLIATVDAARAADSSKDAQHATSPEAPTAPKEDHPTAIVKEEPYTLGAPLTSPHEMNDVQTRKVTGEELGRAVGGSLASKPKGAKTPVATAVTVQASNAAVAAARSPLTTVYLDPQLIDVKDAWNARTDMGDLEELGRQIKSQKAIDGIGLLHDLRVQEKGDGSGRYWLIDGERRWQAVMGLIDAGEEFPNGIPCKVEAADANTDDLIIKMFLANEGKPLLPYEEGLFFKRLQDSGMTMKEMEEKTGRSDSTIWYGLALVEADDDLVDAIRKGTVGATIAKTIAVNARGNKARQKELVAKAIKAKGDKAKTAELKKEIDEDRRKKAAKERPGLSLKARKADEAEIAAMGEKVGARLKEVMESFGMDFDTDMREWIGNDRELQIAANFGALTALKAVMGVKEKVSF